MRQERVKNRERSMPPADTAEESWRRMLLERLQKLESSLDFVRTEVAEVKTSSAVAANESKSRSDAMNRVEDNIKDLAKLVRDLEKSLADTPKGQAEIDKRVKVLEEWQQNLMGRLAVLGFIAATLTSVATALAIKMLGGS
jgi:DNA repair ATPase RecN